MAWSNDKVDQALLAFFEDDMASVASSRNYALPDIEALFLKMAQRGSLDSEDAGRAGNALREIREALHTVHKWLTLFRGSRPGEVMMIQIDESGLLLEIPPRSEGTWLNGVVRRFCAIHDREPARLIVPRGAQLPSTLRRALARPVAALDGRTLEVIENEDKRLRPGRACLVA